MFNLSLHEPTPLAFSTGLRPLAPTAPDYGICDRRYGARLTPLLCTWAAESLTEGNSPFPYAVSGGPAGPQALPHTAMFGNCKVWVEIAGPVMPQVYEAIPDEIRGMAAWIIDGCVAGIGGGSGGFVTRDISKLTAYITEPDTKITGTYPASTAFLTVTITGSHDQSPSPPSPGNFDPSIAQHLAETEIQAWNKAAPGSQLRLDFASRQQYFTRQSMRMRTGGSSITWWGSNPSIAIAET